MSYSFDLFVLFVRDRTVKTPCVSPRKAGRKPTEPLSVGTCRALAFTLGIALANGGSVQTSPLRGSALCWLCGIEAAEEGRKRPSGTQYVCPVGDQGGMAVSLLSDRMSIRKRFQQKRGYTVVFETGECELNRSATGKLCIPVGVTSCRPVLQDFQGS